MRKVMIFILSLIFVNVIGQQTQIDVKKAIVRNWIIYQGDTLGVLYYNSDTLFWTQGVSTDTILIDNHWTLTGDDIENNNAGDVYLKGMTRPDSVKIDSLRGTNPGIDVNQVDSVLQDLSANTGTDYTISTAYVAFKFTASASTNYRTVGIRAKSDGTITNVAAYLQPKIYTDNAGVPGTNLSSGYQNVCFGYIGSTYSEHVLQVGGPLLTSGTSYWVVIYRSAAPSGGNIYLDCVNTGTALCATSTNGSSWTPANNVTGWLKFYFSNNPGLEINARNYFAIGANSINSYGVEATSIYDPAGRFVSINSQGLVGGSTYDKGVNAYSTYGYAVQGVSTNEIGIAAASGAKHGINGETTISSYSYAGVRGFAADAIGVLGISTNKYGIQAQSTNNFCSYMWNANSQGVSWFLSNYSGTNDLQRIIYLTRETSGTPAAGLGGSIDVAVENSSGTDVTIGRIGLFSQKVTASSERGAIGFYTKGDSNPPKLRSIVDSTGNFICVNKIGVGDWKVPAYTLDVSGTGFFADDLTLDDNMGFVGAGTISTTGNGTMTLDVGTGKVDITGDLEVDGTITNLDSKVTAGYTLPIFVGGLTSPADATTYYFGSIAGTAPSTTATERKMYIPKTGTIKSVYLSTNCTTAGTNEDWPMYIRLNNTTDYGIDTVGVSANLRQWNNASLNIAVTAGEYIEIKTVTPTWGTNPATFTSGGYIYIEQ